MAEVEVGPEVEGSVKFWSDAKGWGFLWCPDGKQAFCHHSAIIGEGYKSLKEGERVRFCVTDPPGGKGPMAVNVRKAAP